VVLTLYRPLYHLKATVTSQKLQGSERFREIADFLRDVLLLSNADLSAKFFSLIVPMKRSGAARSAGTKIRGHGCKGSILMSASTFRKSCNA
jgi:hypothetical protein